ncbi:IPT/TIG domain-containing protein, partial [Winogradskyella psychrotolerans]|uniref:IPT/TIG domain-containing protein n=1 Tax=Winogradskyella psychrotolerans TaxID=1344585 RepID=UPI001C065AD8
MKRIHLLIHFTYLLSLSFITNTYATVGSDIEEVNSFCPAPIINTFTPASGPENTLITINGSNFDDATSVTIDGINTNFTIISNSQITALVPDGAMDASSISISSNGGCIGSSSTDFTVLESSCSVSEIYFSELYDAQSGAFGIIELYNPTNTTVNLDGVYEIFRYGNIGEPDADATVIPLTGSIPSLSTFIIQSNGSDACTGFSVDFTLGAGFNDNDEFKLKKNGIVIDNVQAIDERGYTIIRNADAIAPSSTFDSNDWYSDGNEDCSDIGSHNVNTSSTSPNIIHPLSQDICENGNTSFSVSVDMGSYTYQWMVLNSSGNWINVTNNSNYAGASSNTLTISNAPSSFNGYQYHCIMTSTDCDLVSNAVQLQVSNPTVDVFSNQSVCSDYTLPALTNGDYYTATNGGGTQLNAGDTISTTQIIYIYNEIGTAPDTCSNESSFQVTVSGTPNVDTLADQTVCSDYTLPALTDGNYFTATDGGGTQLNAGDTISTTQTIYIYNEVGTAPDTCSNESSFEVTVSGTPNVDTLADQTVCSDYTLPALTDGNYYT